MTGMLRRISVTALILVMLFSFIPADQMDIHAAATIGTLNGTPYDDFDDLIDDLEDDYENRPVTIEMTTNWDALEDSDYDERLIIPSGCKATLNMNGWVFDRGNNIENDWSYNGELICVESGASLTVNGGPKTLHYENVYTSTSRDGKATASRAFHGGVLTGGASTGGAGGIHVKSDCTITLNDVTLAGCRAEAPWYDSAGTNSAYGGGIWLKGGNSNLRMNNSTITGCFAYYDGGGVFQSNHNYVNIELKNSHIDENYAADEGGGLDVDGEYIHLSGTNGSTISGNKSATAGGGIYIWNDDTSLTGFTMENNESKNGGAVYTKESTISLSALTIRNNKASERGGGIYINNNGNSISACEITGNQAGISGAGVYVNEDVYKDFAVTGKTIIRDNSGHNLYISDNDPDDSKVAFNLTKGSDVHLSYYNTEDRNAIMVNRDGSAYKDINCIQFLTADNPGYHFTFNPKPNYRKIFYVKDGKDDTASYGDPEQKPNNPTDVSASSANNASGKTASDHSTSAGVVGKVSAGGEKSDSGEYDLIRGFYTHEKTDSDTEDTESSFYYSDAFFDETVDPKIYNEHLATASWILAFSGTYLRKFDEEDANGNIYYNKHAGARQFFADIGCPDRNIYVNKSMMSKPGLDTIGVTIGSKELAKTGGDKTGKILIPVAVRGGGYEAEWASNVTLGKAAAVADKEAQGFAEAANEVTKEIDKYIRSYELEEKAADGDLVFWVSGFSRAGATANLTAKRLIEKYACDEDGKRNKVFAYPCEAPKGGTDAAEKKDPEKYFCIHNMINAIDIVPLVATTQMGCKRYGVDHYIPGTDKYTYKSDATKDQYAYDDGAYLDEKDRSETSVIESGSCRIKKTVTNVSQGGAGGPDKVTTYRDNDIRLQSNFLDGNEVGEEGSAETNEFYKKYMLPQLRAIDSGIVYDNYFHPMTMDFIPPKMKEYGYYKGNHIEFFVQDFVRILQEGTDINDANHWSRAVKSRDYWAETLQPAMRDTMSLVFSMSGDDSAGFIGRAGSIMDKISIVGGEVSMWEIYRNVLGEWYKLSQADKDKYTTFLMKKLKETGAFEFLSESDRSKLEKNWPALADFIFHITDADYNYYPANISSYNKSKMWGEGTTDERDVRMAFVPTFATFSSFILQNHYPEINIAWTRSYDSYYENEKTEYEIKTDGYTVDKPALSLKSTDGKEEELEEGEQANEVSGDQEMIFDVGSIAGEAVYYDVLKYNGVDKYVPVTENQLYRKGATLEANDNRSVTKYKVKAYAMSYGVKSSEAEYVIEVHNDRHKVMVTAEKADGTGEETNEQRYKEGDKVRITAVSPSEKYFTSWAAELFDQDGNKVRDITEELLGDSTGSTTAAFTMPAAGEDHPEGYEIRLKASYGDRVKKITGALDEPVPGQALDTEAELTFDNGASAVKRPVTWTYTYEDSEGAEKTVSADKGYDDTTYQAEISISPDQAEGLMFSKELEWAGGTDFTLKSIRRNDTDDSVTILLEYKTDKVEGETHTRPDAYIPLTINEMDLSRSEDNVLGTVDSSVLQGQEVTITAPELEDERFAGWDLKIKDGEANYGQIALKTGSDLEDKTITITTAEEISVEELVIEAKYMPVVNEIKVTADEPVGGKKLADTAGITIKITNEYQISPENISIQWFPAPSGDGDDKKAEYMTAYTAVVSIEPDEDGNVNVKAPDASDYESVNMTFIYSDALTVTVNGNKAVCDTVNGTVSYTFGATKYTLDSVTDPEDITGVKHGASKEDITGMLPATTKVTTRNGVSLDAEVTWGEPVSSAPADPRNETVWTAQGTVTLPATVKAQPDADLTVNVKVFVNEANHISAPVAVLPSGEYLYDQSTALETAADEGYSTYYTTDGSDPTKTSKKYTEGEEIALLRSEAQGEGTVKRITLKAYTIKEDGSEFDSQVATYVYDFTNDVTVPSGRSLMYSGEHQTGVDGGAFYELVAAKGSGVVIDEKGNATALDAGRYTVTAKVKEGYRWKIPKDTSESGDSGDDFEYTEEDQTIEFEILKNTMKNVVIKDISDQVYTGYGVQTSLKVMFGEKELTEGVDYLCTYRDNVDVGTAMVTVNGRGSFEGAVSGAFNITRASVTVTADDKDKIHGDEDPELTWTAEGVANKDVLKLIPAVIVRQPGEDVGTYEIMVSGETSFDNFNVRYVNGKFTIIERGPSDRTWTLTFDGNGGTGEMKDEYVTKGKKYKLPENGFDAPAGKEFDGWTISETGKEETPDDAEAVKYAPGEQADITAHSTVKAQWKDKEPEPEDRSKQKGEDGTWFGKGASLEAAEAALSRLTTDKDPKGTKFAPLKVKSTKQTKKSIKITWKKASGAKKYIIYTNRCGKGRKFKKLVTLSSGKRAYNVKKAAGKKLRKATYYKFIIIAVDKNNDVVTTSKIKHVATAGSKKKANYRKVIVKAKVTKTGKKLKKYKATSAVLLKKGKAATLKAVLKKAKKTKVKKHVGARYESSNVKIAKVTSKGKVKALKKGTCKIYVFAQSGIVKTVKVTVK